MNIVRESDIFREAPGAWVRFQTTQEQGQATMVGDSDTDPRAPREQAKSPLRNRENKRFQKRHPSMFR